jgi:hypothetical protein
MMMYKKIVWSVFLALVILSACQKVELPEEAAGPSLTGEEAIYDYSTNGFDMHVVEDENGNVEITTSVSARQPEDGDPYLVKSIGAEGVELGTTTFEDPAGSGETFTQLDFPAGSGTYWAVPFDPTLEPVKIEEVGGVYTIKFGLGPCKCMGFTGPNCIMWGVFGCKKLGCASCGRKSIMINTAAHPNLIVQAATGSPYAVFEKDHIKKNGVDY